MSDVAVVASATVAAPRDYTIPGAQELLPKSVSASMDGTGAGSAWYPCLQVLDPSGRAMFSARADTIVAAGASVDASWFPGVKSGAAALSNPGLMAARVNIVGNQSVAAGDPGAFITWGEAQVDTGTPTPFWSAGQPTRMTAPVNGVYLSLINLEWDVLTYSTQTPAYTAAYLYKNAAASPNYFYDVNEAERSGDNVGFANRTSYSLSGSHHNIWALNAGDYFRVLAYNNNTGQVARNLLDLRPTENHYCSWAMVLVATL